eukprot:TRINITY_DN6487_c0_g2_i2.p1 TRINITY_DN6487_c0_g2~~TRINITY_DN6487_c0_g2_i2.p1  ORF type:complete len:282 (+),score=34.01 TRINITY_DN6487_c0_g2_i2:33-878(+)
MEVLTQRLWGGIDPTNMADGGPDCIAQVSIPVRLLYSLPLLLIAWYVWPRCSPRCLAQAKEADWSKHSWWRTAARKGIGMVQIISLAAMIVYKYHSNTLIYVLMPCHFVGFAQAYLCFYQSLPTFRIFIHYGTYGALVGLLLPELSTLKLPWEIPFFFLEHGLLLVVPIILCWCGAYSVEPLSEMCYCQCAWALNVFVGCAFHQALSVLLQGNFNLMGCKADSVHPEVILWGVDCYQWVGLIFVTFSVFTCGKLFGVFLGLGQSHEASKKMGQSHEASKKA